MALADCRIFIKVGSSSATSPTSCSPASLDDDATRVMKKGDLKKAAEKLGAKQAESLRHADVVVFANASEHFIENALALGIPVVKPEWVSACKKANKKVDTRPYLVVENLSTPRRGGLIPRDINVLKPAKIGNETAQEIIQRNKEKMLKVGPKPDKYIDPIERSLFAMKKKKETRSARDERRETGKVGKRKNDGRLGTKRKSSRHSLQEIYDEGDDTDSEESEDSTDSESSESESRSSSEESEEQERTKRRNVPSKVVAKRKEGATSRQKQISGNDEGEKKKKKEAIEKKKVSKGFSNQQAAKPPVCKVPTSHCTEETDVSFEKHSTVKVEIEPQDDEKSSISPSNSFIYPVAVAVTGDSDNRETIMEILENLKVPVVPNVFGRVQKPSHLVADGENPTTKIYYALAAGIPIITSQWIYESLEATDARRTAAKAAKRKNGGGGVRQRNAEEYPESGALLALQPKYFHPFYSKTLQAMALQRQEGQMTQHSIKLPQHKQGFFLASAAVNSAKAKGKARGALRNLMTDDHQYSPSLSPTPFLQGKVLHLQGHSELPTTSQFRELLTLLGADVTRNRHSRHLDYIIQLSVPNCDEEACQPPRKRKKVEKGQRNDNVIVEDTTVKIWVPVLRSQWVIDSIDVLSFVPIDDYVMNAEATDPQQKTLEIEAESVLVGASSLERHQESPAQQQVRCSNTSGSGRPYLEDSDEASCHSDKDEDEKHKKNGNMQQQNKRTITIPAPPKSQSVKQTPTASSTQQSVVPSSSFDPYASACQAMLQVQMKTERTPGSAVKYAQNQWNTQRLQESDNDEDTDDESA